MGLKVELDVFSGRPNPSWELSREEMTKFESIVQSARPGTGEIELPGLGYRGFVVHGGTDLRIFQGALLKDEISREVAETIGKPNVDLERWLLETGKPYLESGIYGAVGEELDRTK
jgi:hypothetical protein